jgi:hypothetical protein
MWESRVDYERKLELKEAINKTFSGERANPLRRFITSSSHYQEKAVKNTVPNHG